MKNNFLRLPISSTWLVSTGFQRASDFLDVDYYPRGGFLRATVLGTGSQWPEPIAILLMMVFTLFGAAAACRAGAQLALPRLW